MAAWPVWHQTRLPSQPQGIVAGTKLCCFVTSRHMCVNNLPKVVTWKHNGRESNLSSVLLLQHQATLLTKYTYKFSSTEGPAMFFFSCCGFIVLWNYDSENRQKVSPTHATLFLHVMSPCAHWLSKFFQFRAWQQMLIIIFIHNSHQYFELVSTLLCVIYSTFWLAADVLHLFMPPSSIIYLSFLS